VGSAKYECLERIVPLGEAHLRAAVRAFVEHYHEERPHQGLGNELIAPKTTSIGASRSRAVRGSAACSSSTAASRNPMYVSELALWLGWAVFYGSVGVSIGLMILFAVLVPGV
jgi:hypothetical protein